MFWKVTLYVCFTGSGEEISRWVTIIRPYRGHGHQGEGTQRGCQGL